MGPNMVIGIQQGFDSDAVEVASSGSSSRLVTASADFHVLPRTSPEIRRRGSAFAWRISEITTGARAGSDLNFMERGYEAVLAKRLRWLAALSARPRWSTRHSS